MLKKLQDLSSSVKVTFVKMNIVEHTSIERAVKTIVTMIGQIDVLINGVGTLADKDVENTIAVNLVSSTPVVYSSPDR